MVDIDETPAAMRTLSVSKIEKALLCPLAMRFQYVDRIPQPSGGKLLAGNVVHEILEFALRGFARTGKYPDWKELDDLYEPTWQKRVAKEEAREDFLGWDWSSDDPEEKVKREYRPLVKIAREQVLPTLKPWMLGGEPVVEYKIDLELQSDVGPFTLLGYLDLLDHTGMLIDWKTTEQEVSKRARKTWLQFAAYSLWAWPIVGDDTMRCEKIFLVRASRPYVERVPFTITPKHRGYLVRVAAEVWKMVHHGVFLPNTETWHCSPKFCAFYAGCQGEIDKPSTTPH